MIPFPVDLESIRQLPSTTGCGCTRSSGEDDRFHRYLEHATASARVIPLGRLGLYKYVTIDTTYEMVRRLLRNLERYLAGDAAVRFEVLRDVRGDWDN